MLLTQILIGLALIIVRIIKFCQIKVMVLARKIVQKRFEIKFLVGESKNVSRVYRR